MSSEIVKIFVSLSAFFTKLSVPSVSVSWKVYPGRRHSYWTVDWSKARTTSKCPRCSWMLRDRLWTMLQIAYTFAWEMEDLVEQAALSRPHLANETHEPDWFIIRCDDTQSLFHYLYFSRRLDPDQLDRSPLWRRLLFLLILLAEVRLGFRKSLSELLLLGACLKANLLFILSCFRLYSKLQHSYTLYSQPNFFYYSYNTNDDPTQKLRR